MTTQGRRGRRGREPWREVLIGELTDETEDERRDFADPERNPFESKHGPEMGTDRDDSPAYLAPKPRFDAAKLEAGDISDPIQIDQTADRIATGQLVEAGHGFIVNDPRSRPWKTAKRTHCAHCGGPLPAPNASHEKYRCEFDPPAYYDEVPPMADGAVRPPLEVWRRFTPAQRRRFATGDTHECECSGCELRWLVLHGHERNRGNPRKYCSENCQRWADNERNAWKRAVRRAEKRGEEPPPPPEDKGLKLRHARGLRSGVEGHGRRYTAANGHRWELPRA